MEIQGKIIAALPEQSGMSRAGNQWKKREYVLETLENYPRKVCFNLFGDRADQYPLTVGEIVTVSFDLESREYNGRWYTDVRAWKVDKGQVAPGGGAQVVGAPAPAYGGAPLGAQMGAPMGTPAPAPATPAGGYNVMPGAPLGAPADSNDDLPF